MKTMWVDLAQRNERDELLLMAGTPRQVVKAMGLDPGVRIVIEDHDFVVPGTVTVKSRGMFVKLDWDGAVYKPMAGSRSPLRVKCYSGVV